jgi:hypothetical protein
MDIHQKIADSSTNASASHSVFDTERNPEHALITPHNAVRAYDAPVRAFNHWTFMRSNPSRRRGSP